MQPKAKTAWEIKPSSDQYRAAAHKLYLSQIGNTDDDPMFVAVQGKDVVGAVWASTYYHPHVKSDVVEFDIAVDPNHVRQGIASALLEQLIQASTFPIVANPVSPEGKALINKFDFKKIGNTHNSYILTSRIHAAIDSDLQTQARRFLDRFYGEFQLPDPEFKIVDRVSDKWVGRTTFRSQEPDTCLIEIQKRILGDDRTLDRVLAHELIHHADFMLNVKGLTDPFTLKRLKKQEAHGKFFREEMARINQALGPDYVTENSDKDFVIATEKEFYLLVQPYGAGYGYNYFLRPSAEDQKGIQLVIDHRQGKLFKVNDRAFIVKNRQKFSPGSFLVPRSTQPELSAKLKELYEGGKQVALSDWNSFDSESPYPFGAPMDQVEIVDPPEVLVDEPLGMKMKTVAATESFLPEDLVMVDCEMTGVDPVRDKLLQIAMTKLKLKGNRYVEYDDPLVLFMKHDGKPQNKFHKQYLMHVFEACNKSELLPEHAKEKIHQFLGPLKGKVTPVGDCVPTDIDFLRHAGCIDAGDIDDDGPIPGTFHYEYFDMNGIKALARHKAGKKEDTKELAGFDGEGIHDALIDCRNQTCELNHYMEILVPAAEYVPHATSSYRIEALTKEEIKEQYAGKTSFLFYPVFIDGETDEHHITVKFFDKTPVTPEQIEEATKGIDKAPPAITGWKPVVLNGKKGDVRVLELEGIPPYVAEIHYALETIRKDEYPDYRPHVTVSDELWEKIKKEKIGPADLGVKTGPLTFESMGRIEKVFSFKIKADNEEDDIPNGVSEDQGGIPKRVINFFRSWDYWGKEKAEQYAGDPDVEAFLARYRPRKPITLYRGLRYEAHHRDQFLKDTGLLNDMKGPNQYDEKHLSAWSYDKDAIHYGEFSADEICDRGLILKATFQPKDVLVDFTLIPEGVADILDLRAEEQEVIIRAGKHPVEVVSVTRYDSSQEPGKRTIESKYEATIQNGKAQTEVFRNPSAKELRLAEGKDGDNMRAFLDGPDLIVWEAGKAIHAQVAEQIKFKSPDPIPLFIYTFGPEGISVQVTDYSKRTPWFHNPSVAKAIDDHPWIKRLGHNQMPDISYFDEDIVGPWCEMETEVSAAVQISFLKQPKLWDGKQPEGARIQLGKKEAAKTYVIEGSPVQWVIEHLDIPEGTLYYEFYQKPADAEGDGTPTLKSPLPVELPDLFFEIYSNAILFDGTEFRTYEVNQDLQDFILRILTAQRAKVPSFKVRATTPALNKTIATQAFLKGGLKSLSSIIDYRLEPQGDVPYFEKDPKAPGSIYRMTDADDVQPWLLGDDPIQNNKPLVNV